MRHSLRLLLALLPAFALVLTLQPRPAAAQPTICCLLPDNGFGTADHVPNCSIGYVGQMVATNGLPLGSSLQFAASLLTRSLRITHENLKLRDPAFVASLDDVRRFRSAHQVESYLGLVPRERSSGEHQVRGRITSLRSQEGTGRSLSGRRSSPAWIAPRSAWRSSALKGRVPYSAS